MLAGVVVTAVSLVLRSQIAATVLLVPYDDGLFLRLAGSIAKGDWLGGYDDLTLAKGPAYPVFLAAVGTLHLPLKLTEHAIYLAAAAGMATVVFRLSRSAALAVILYAALALSPTMWGLGLARIIRDGFYVALSLGVVAVAAWLLLADLSARAGARRRGASITLVAGVLIAVYWLTREEGVWLVPALGVLVVGAAGLLWAGSSAAEVSGIAGTWRPMLAVVGLPLVLATLAAAAVLVGVAAINADRYGVALTNDLTEGSFPAAYGALARIEHEATDRYVPVPASARADAYRVSPAAAELEPFLDGESGAAWTAIGCGGPPDPARGCTDIRGGWFMWAIRDAVELAGHWRSAPEAQAYLARVADEVNAACDDGRLACGPKRASLTPPLGIDALADAAAHIAPGITVMTGAEPPVRMGSSAGPAVEVVGVALRVGPVAPLAPTTPPQLRVRGWVAGSEGVPSVSLVASGGGRGDAQVTTDPAPDVDAFFVSRGDEGISSRRFELITDCVAEDCRLRVRGADGGEQEFRIGDLGTGPVLQSASLWLFIEAVEPVRSAMEEVLDAATVRAHPRILGAMQWLQGAFGILVPIGATLGMAGIGLALLRSSVRSRLAALLVLAAACVLAVAARLMLVALIEVTSWPGALNDIYLAPGSPFLITFAALGCYLGLMAVTDLVRERRRTDVSPS